jgi:hypothetical protein
MNFKSNPKRKPGKNRPASSRRLIQGPQLRDFTKESLKFFPGTSKLIVLAQLWGYPKTATIYFRKAKCTQRGAQPGDAVGRLTRELSLSGDPGAKVFCEKLDRTQKRRTSARQAS